MSNNQPPVMDVKKLDPEIPGPGNWPADPQEAIPVSADKIWVDGCFDFSHHGHAGAMLQARRLGKELVVGVHSDEEILEHKGPTVMNLKERTLASEALHSISAVNACRWSTVSIPSAPYVTSLPWISHYGCHYVVHGDDITSDSNGEDCYRYVKAAGRFLVVKRTPGISTTDLVGRMLLCTKAHFIKSLTKVLTGEEGSGSDEERKKAGEEMKQRIKEYAADETGVQPGPEVWSCIPGTTKANKGLEDYSFEKMVEGKASKPGQRVVYVDGGFDLFCSGHIEFLRQVQLAEEELGRKVGWFASEARAKRIEEHGEDFGPAFLVAGIHDDAVINHWKGVNYPIMNIFERGLCVLQCRYIHCVIFSAPFTPSKPYLTSLPYSTPHAVYHGPTAFIPLTYDPYTAPKDMGIFNQVAEHAFQNVDAGEIVMRIMKSRAAYEERQRMKGFKAEGEELVRKREEEERKIRETEKEITKR